MVRVHVGVNLKHKAGELLLGGLHLALLGLHRTRRRRYAHKAVEQFLYAKRVEGRAEKYRGRLALKVVLLAELRIHAVDQVDVAAQLRGVVGPHGSVDGGRVDVVDLHTLGHMLLVGLKQVEAVLIYVIHAFEVRTYVDGPAQRAHAYLQLLLQLVENVKRVAALVVELVDKYNHRSVAHAAHLHQLARLCLHAFCHVHHYNHAVYCGEGAVGVFSKILVARGVENVDFVVAIVEAHHRCGHRDAALLLNLHPVAGGRFLDFVRLHSSRHMNGAAKQQQLFGECGLARVGVRDYGERAPLGYFVL